MSMSKYTIIPNSFQYPNYYNDVLDQYLTAEESKVLTRAIREIFGWEETRQTRTARISLSVFIYGNKKIGSGGIGIKKEAVINALDNLHKFGILIKAGKARDPRGRLYRLNMDVSKIDMKGLSQRKLEKEALNKKRTSPARAAKKKRNLSDSTGTGTVEQTSTGTVGQTSTGTVGQTSTGTVGQTSTGTVGQTSTGTVGQTSTGTVGQTNKKPRKRKETKEKDHQQPQQRSAQISESDQSQKNTIAAVAEQINFLLSQQEEEKNVRRAGQRRTGERITVKDIKHICSAYVLISPREVLRCASALAPKPHIKTVIGLMRGGKNGNHAENTCWDNGKCALPVDESLLQIGNPPNPDSPQQQGELCKKAEAGNGNQANWEAEFNALPEEDQSVIRAQAEKEIGEKSLARMQPTARLKTINTIALQIMASTVRSDAAKFDTTKSEAVVS